MRVSEVMTREPICCIRTTSVMNAARMMKEFDVGILLVIDDLWTRKLIGVVTDRDLCLTALGEVHDPTLTTVEDCMATNVLTCTPDTEVRDVLAAMATVGDGCRGLRLASPFNAIVVSAAAASIPPALLEQLEDGGRMVIPVGPRGLQDLQLVRKSQHGLVVSVIGMCCFVPLIRGHGFATTARTTGRRKPDSR